MDFDNRRAKTFGSIKLIFGRFDKQRHTDTRIAQFRHKPFKVIVAADNIQTAFCGPFFTLFRHQTYSMWLGRQRNRQHFVSCCHLEIKGQINFSAKSLHILVTDMATVFAQMRGNAIGTSSLCKGGGPHGIRTIATTRISNGSNMIDINAEPKFRTHGVSSCFLVALFAALPIFSLALSSMGPIPCRSDFFIRRKIRLCR